MNEFLDWFFGDEDTIIIIVIFIVFLLRALAGVVIDYVAKQRKTKYGFVFGFLFGIIPALLILFCIPDKSYKEIHVIIDE